MWSSLITRRRQRAFTLAEIMVSLLFLSIALLGLVSSQIYSLRASGGNRGRHYASLLAGRIMNEKKEVAKTDFSKALQQDTTPVAGEEGYSYRVIEELKSSDFKKITVTVYWREDSLVCEYSLWTYFYKGTDISS
ncbi:MAG: prepilin-type N-terminal cleavage/methylation domain-containing protein [Candidatus Eremiobacteraeota bacterium]|nr:prepilin-type N-terminal cleavage/methylation domain-containing protein [Candidatus Eremiobacteraeota bacterium]